MVDTGAKFLVPSRYGDVITIETSARDIRRSSFDIAHRVFRDDTLAIEAFETRVWAGRDPENPDRIKGFAIPEEVAAALRG
jgi:4-hydroxybenzoyl-CoA thioesterase